MCRGLLAYVVRCIMIRLNLAKVKDTHLKCAVTVMLWVD